MRRGWTGGAVLVALGLAVWFGSSSGPESSGQSQAHPPRRSPSSTRGASVPSVIPPGVPTAGQTPAPRDTLHIQGTVYGPEGPLPGVTVVATAPVPGETLSTLPCEEDARRSLLDCQNLRDGGELKWVALLAERQGEALEHTRTVSAADGTFTLEGLAPGTYALWAEAATGAALLQDVEAGSEGLTLQLGQGWLIAGQVRDASGPAPGVRITAVHLAHSRFFETLSGEDGRFRLGPLPPGPSLVLFSRAGSLPILRRIAHSTEDLLEFLSPEQRLSGQVVHQGVPAPGTRVQLEIISSLELDAPLAEEGLLEALTDAEGRFTFSGLRSSFYELTATRHGQGAVAQVHLDKGSNEVVLELGTSSQLEGLVRDEAGHPVEGAFVTFSPATGATLSLEESRHTRTDAQGRYWLGPLTPGEGQLFVSAKRYEDVSQEVTLSRWGSPQDVTLMPAARVEGEVERGGAVSGSIQDEAGTPAWRAELWVWSQHPEEAPSLVRMTSVDARGRFWLEHLAPGRYLLQVQEAPRDSLRHLTHWVEVKQEEEVQVALRLPQGRTLSGQVLDTEGHPLQGAQVHALVRTLQVPGIAGSLPTLGLRSHASTDAQGRFSLQGITHEELLLEAELSGYKAGSLRIRVDAPELRLVLRRESEEERLEEEGRLFEFDL